MRTIQRLTNRVIPTCINHLSNFCLLVYNDQSDAKQGFFHANIETDILILIRQNHVHDTIGQLFVCI